MLPLASFLGLERSALLAVVIECTTSSVTVPCVTASVIGHTTAGVAVHYSGFDVKHLPVFPMSGYHKGGKCSLSSRKWGQWRGSLSWKRKNKEESEGHGEGGLLIFPLCWGRQRGNNTVLYQFHIFMTFSINFIIKHIYYMQFYPSLKHHWWQPCELWTVEWGS